MTSSVMAELQPFVLKSANLQYKNESGEISAAEFKYYYEGEQYDFKPFKGKLIKDNGNLAFLIDGKVVQVPQLNFILSAAEQVKLKNGTILTQGNSMTAKADYVFTQGQEKKSTVYGLNLKCSGKNSRFKTEHFKIFDTCVQKGTSVLTVKKIVLDPPVGFRELENGVLKIQNSDYRLNGKVRIKNVPFMDGKMEGRLFYNEKRERLSVSFEEAKVGIINIRPFIFPKMAKQSEKIKGMLVESPYIHYSLPKDKHLSLNVIISSSN